MRTYIRMTTTSVYVYVLYCEVQFDSAMNVLYTCAILWLASTIILLNRLMNWGWMQLTLRGMAITLLDVSLWTRLVEAATIEEPGQSFLSRTQ